MYRGDEIPDVPGIVSGGAIRGGTDEDETENVSGANINHREELPAHEAHALGGFLEVQIGQRAIVALHPIPRRKGIRIALDIGPAELGRARAVHKIVQQLHIISERRAHRVGHVGFRAGIADVARYQVRTERTARNRFAPALAQSPTMLGREGDQRLSILFADGECAAGFIRAGAAIGERGGLSLARFPFRQFGIESDVQRVGRGREAWRVLRQKGHQGAPRLAGGGSLRQQLGVTVKGVRPQKHALFVRGHRRFLERGDQLAQRVVFVAAGDGSGGVGRRLAGAIFVEIDFEARPILRAPVTAHGTIEQALPLLRGDFIAKSAAIIGEAALAEIRLGKGEIVQSL